MKPLRLLALAAIGGSLAAVASADISFGGTRSAGMAGAGLALTTDSRGPGNRNPANYAFKRPFRFTAPELRYNLQGIGWGDLNDFFNASSSGVLNVDNLGRLAQQFGDRNTEFGLGLGFGVQFDTIGIDFRGEGSGRTNPNASLRNWVNSGNNIALLPADARLDGYGIGNVELGVSMGQQLQSKMGNVAVGARLKLTQSYYSHYIADQAAIIGGVGGAPAPEMGGDKVLKKSGVGLDIGANLQPSAIPGASAAIVVNNFLAPNSSFRGIAPDLGANEALRAFPRTVDLGVAYQRGYFTLAADLVDALNAGSSQDLRLGGEINLGKAVAVRAGLASRSGMTIGLGVGGFNIAYGGRLPLEAGYVIRF